MDFERQRNKSYDFYVFAYVFKSTSKGWGFMPLKALPLKYNLKIKPKKAKFDV